MKIVIFDIEPPEARAFERLEAQHQLVQVEAPLRADNAHEFADARIISTFIYSEINAQVLDRLPDLRLIATRSTGVDHIDMHECAARSITVCNVPTYGENTVAEHVFALLLTISHRMLQAVERARTGPFSPEGLEGFDLKDKTLGVVGTGHIGRHVVRIARGFEMKVAACDLMPDQRFAKEMGFRYLPFEQVLAAADVLTLHVPATPETHNLISDREFARMKDGSVLINTARGSVVEARALVQALSSGKLAAAGLDVLPDEPMIREEAELIGNVFAQQHDLRNLVADHVLLRMPNVVVTPHSAFNTREAIHRIVETTVDNIAAFLHDQPQNIVPAPRAAA